MGIEIIARDYEGQVIPARSHIHGYMSKSVLGLADPIGALSAAEFCHDLYSTMLYFLKALALDLHK
jgi:hypothetical protein